MKNALLCASIGVLLLGSSCNRKPSPDVAATVNDKPITYADLDKQFAFQFGGATDRTSDDQLTIQKLEFLRVLIDNEIMLQKAEKLGLLATDSDVDAKLNEMKAPYTQEEFQKHLTARKMSVDDLKGQIRRELSIEKLFNKEIRSLINITDQDIKDYYNANKANFNLPEPQVHLAQILVTPIDDPTVRNLKNDKAKTEAQAQAKIIMIEQRLKGGEDFGTLATNFSEDPQTAANGGDLGFMGESTLDKANPELRKLIMSLQAGAVSSIIKTQEGFRILKVIAKEPAGQRDLNDPRVQQGIREGLVTRKDQLAKAAFYETARNDAKVGNYFSQKIMANLAAKK
ncbi:peptidylprolyl isomerase [Bryobacter aggregatus]|uniref:peptidylprolyl isomerase n=1 Tax=Bryobacter aggregatus TaxID=360054 RepID=UPI0004E1603D|nr:peptidylprolyl isomerase [Bryobacter aggregatus]